MDATDLRRPSGASLSLCTQTAHTDSAAERLQPWPARTLTIVSGKGGLVPSNDSPKAAGKLVELGNGHDI
jgi:hypothetical protein